MQIVAAGSITYGVSNQVGPCRDDDDCGKFAFCSFTANETRDDHYISAWGRLDSWGNLPEVGMCMQCLDADCDASADCGCS